MKKYLGATSYCFSVLLFGMFLFLLTDLSQFGRVGKLEGFWYFACLQFSGGQQQLCMATYDDICILLVLGLLTISAYISFRTYKWWILLVPLLGGIVGFILCSNFLNWI